MPNVRKFYHPDCTGHGNVKRCPLCGPIARAQYSKTWWNTRTPEQYEHVKSRRNAYRRAKAVLICKGCGEEPREYGKRFGPLCLEAYREWSQTAYRNRRKREGAPPRDAKKAYQQRLKKHGKAKLASYARWRYHERKFRERQADNEELPR